MSILDNLMTADKGFWNSSLTTKLTSLPGIINQGYRPPQWIQLQPELLVYIKTNIGGLFFDAVLNTSTESSLTVTSHPVQNGANISDHAYMEPVRLSMEIAMSDAMASMVPGQFYGAYSKSISAYRALVDLQAARTPVRVQTKLNSYENMLITNISVNDDVHTQSGLRATVQLQQILIANVSSEKVSARSWTSGGAANKGPVQPKTNPKSIGAGIDPKGGTQD